MITYYFLYSLYLLNVCFDIFILYKHMFRAFIKIQIFYIIKIYCIKLTYLLVN